MTFSKKYKYPKSTYFVLLFINMTIAFGCIESKTNISRPVGSEPVSRSEDEDTPCNLCVKVLNIEVATQQTVEVCDFCLRMLELERDGKSVSEMLDKIKKNIRYQLDQNFKNRNTLTNDREITSVLANIVAILKFHKKIYKKFPPENSKEKEELKIIENNIENYKKELLIRENPKK